MSRKAQTQDTDDPHTNHVPTNGPFAKYLWDENPNAPVSKLVDRFRNEWDKDRREESLSRIRANFSCPECGSSHVYYTQQINVARCDGCGTRITEVGRSADELPRGR